MTKTPLYIGEPHDAWRSPVVEDRARQTILWCLQESAQHYAKLRQNWDDWFDRYSGKPLALRQTNRVRSNVPSGRVSEMVDTYRADYMDQIFKHYPIISAYPMQTEDQEVAKIREDLIQFQLDNATPDMGSWPVFDTTLFMALLFGGCPSKMTWVTRTMKEAFAGVEGSVDIPVYSGPAAVPWFPYDWFPHPHKQWADDAYPAVGVSFDSYDDLVRLNKADVYTDAVKDIPDMTEMTKVLGDDGRGVLESLGDLHERLDQKARLGWTDKDTRLHQDGVLVLECECMFRPKVDWTDAKGRRRSGEDPVRSIITMANGVVVRVSPSPMRTGASVWSLAKLNHIPGQLFGMSLVQKNKPQIHMEEVALNMALQNLAQTVNKMKVVRPDLLFSASSLDDQPGGVLFAKPGADVNAVAREIPTSSVINEAMAIMNYGSSRAEGTSGATELKQGRMPSGERTATASNLAFQQSSVRFKHGLAWYGASFVLPMARKMDAYNTDFLPTPIVARVIGEDRAMRFSQVTDDVLRVPMDYQFMGPTRDDNEQLVIAQLQNALKTMTPLVQLMPGMDAAAKEIVVQILDRFNIPDMEKIKQLIGYGTTTPVMDPSMGGSGAGVRPSGPSQRRESRIGNPTSAMGLAKSIGGTLAKAGRG